MRVRIRDLAAVAVAVVAIAFGIAAAFVELPDPGFALGPEPGAVVVTRVHYGSPAQRSGLLVGSRFDAIDDELLASLDAAQVQAVAAGHHSPVSLGTGCRLISPSPAPANDPLAGEPYVNCDAGVFVLPYGGESRDALPGLILGTLLFVFAAVWLSVGRSGPLLRPMAVTLPVAMSLPLLLLPVAHLATGAAAVATAVLASAGMLPLAADLLERVENRIARWLGVAVVLATATGAAAAGLLLPLFEASAPVMRLVWPVAVACIVFFAGLVAAAPFLRRMFARRSEQGAAPLMDGTQLLVVAVTPGIAAISLVPRGFNAWPIFAWLLVVVLASRITLRPLLGLLYRATVQRDAIVAATELERARIAADIHDDALQDLTLLVRRLDAAGDTEGAEAARQVADRLRGICGELRLPILDDLGLGPALEWLAERLEPAAGGPIHVERGHDERRLPGAAELALFRIAQEALTNAVRHGAAPITIRYRGGGTWAELDVDDSGKGFDPAAASLARESGHFGLLNMAQRAEGAGATLDVGRRPGGGTRVRVVWEAAPEPEPMTAPAAAAS